MKTYVLKIPLSKHNLEWMRFANMVSATVIEKNSILRVDFMNVSFLSTAQFVVLACSIEELHQKYSCKVEFVGGTNGLNTHLNNIKFKLYWTENFKRDNYTASLNNTTLCPWHISKNMIDQYGQQAQQYFRNADLRKKDLQPLSQSLVEVFNNIFDHSKSTIQGYVITQHFPNIHRLRFAVCDFGIGIPTTINNYLFANEEYELKHNLAIEKALERGMTIGSIPNNAGFGLANVHDFIECSKGRIEIFSNGGFYIKDWNADKRSGLLSYPFDGTLITVDVDTRTFDEFDSSDEIYDF